MLVLFNSETISYDSEQFYCFFWRPIGNRSEGWPLREMTAAEESLIDQTIYERIFKTSIV
jgi:hypothetical protein